MDVARFELERWFARYEHEADLMLAESGVRPLDAARFDTVPDDLGYVIPTNGDPELRASLAERYGREADEVCCTCGTQEANLLVTLATLSPGDHAVVVTPTYQSLYSLPEVVADVTRVELSPPDWSLDPDAVAEAIRPETRLVVVNNPNNPTGVYHDEATMRAVYDLAADADAYLLCDEVYRLLAADPIPPVASFGPLGISTTSLSKAYGLAGLRFGWVAGPPSVVENVERWKDYTTISPSAFGQHVGRQALADEAAILAENRDLVARNHDLVADFVDDHGLDWYDPVGCDAFPTVPDGFPDGHTFCRRVVEEESVVLAPGEAFGHPDRFRVGFGCETATLREGLRRVECVVDGN